MKTITSLFLGLLLAVGVAAQTTQSFSIANSTNGALVLLTGSYDIESITLINPGVTNAVTIELYDSSNTTNSQSITYTTVTQAAGYRTNVYTQYGVSTTNIEPGLVTTVATGAHTVTKPLITSAVALPVSGSVSMTGVGYTTAYGLLLKLTGTNVLGQAIVTYR